MGMWMDRLMQRPVLEAVQRLKPLAAEAGLWAEAERVLAEALA